MCAVNKMRSVSEKPEQLFLQATLVSLFDNSEDKTHFLLETVLNYFRTLQGGFRTLEVFALFSFYLKRLCDFSQLSVWSFFPPVAHANIILHDSLHKSATHASLIHPPRHSHSIHVIAEGLKHILFPDTKILSDSELSPERLLNQANLCPQRWSLIKNSRTIIFKWCNQKGKKNLKGQNTAFGTQ